MGWRFAASCKKVRTLRQSTPFHEPKSSCVWIARFIHHTATASVTNVTETNSHVKRNRDGIARHNQFQHYSSQQEAMELLALKVRLELKKKS
jgi:hypothetical protein